MKFLQFLNENEITDKDIEEIRKDCAVYINWQRKQSEPLPIYRGKKTTENISIITRRKDRKPMNTRLIVNELFDDLLYKKFKWKPRSQGVFATSNADTAGGYATLNIFFPIGDYRYVWNTRHEDLFLTHNMSIINREYISRTDNRIDGKHKEYEWKDEQGKKDAERLLQELVDDCIDTDLEKAIRTGHEIMFDVDKYYLVSISNYKLDSFYNTKKTMLNLFKRIIG